MSARKRKRRTAGKSKLLEQCVDSLKLANFRIFSSFKAFEKELEIELDLSNGYVILGYPHTGLYGGRGVKEALIIARDALSFVKSEDGYVRVVIEAKWQECSGSTDEKLPYIWEQAQISDIPNWVAVLDGDFWQKHRRGIDGFNWLKQRASTSQEGKTFTVVSRIEFIEILAKEWGLKS